MGHRQGGHRTKSLVFPSNWSGKWLFRAIINTPKWQINSILNSYKFSEWIGYLSSYLNGLKLPDRTSPEENYVRSVVVGIKVSQASKDYQNAMNKIPVEDKVRLLKDEIETPIVGDMIKTLTEATLPSTLNVSPVSLVNVKSPQETVEEKGKEIPVEILS